MMPDRPPLLMIAAALLLTASVARGDDLFEKQVRPVLAEHCFECHGPKKQKAGLRLDSRAAMLEGGDTGPALVPGHPGQSLLIKALHYKDEPRMPPKGPLAGAQVAALTEWVKQGAKWPDAGAVRAAKEDGFTVTPKDRAFWSFRPVTDPPVPSVRDAGWARTTIDRFILAKLEAANLRPAEEADARTLIRRVTFDLTGLPPTPEEVDAFVRGYPANPQAEHGRLVERLLASPHYGERWARHWLDVARYGEDQAHTFQARKYPQGFRYRDWLIKAFNDDLPYDRFLTEQLAADLLGPDRKEHLPALGFFALGPVYYGDPKKLDQIDDRIDTLTRGLLGLTVACARCHDHKYDPISTKDYYALAGVIASTDYAEVPLIPEAEVAKLRAALTEEQKKKKEQPKFPFVHAIKDGTPVTMKVHLRGNPMTLGEEAPRRFMEVLARADAAPFSKGSGRLELAREIAGKDNPLTARVFVNRVWRHHFGKGLVRTPSNFGALGEPPTHPELLDHLAARFVASGWSVKQLHRDIVLSSAYRMSSRPDVRGQDVDPDNKLLWRMNRRRLDVEAWRDAMLAAAGTLDRAVGGPSLDLADAKNRRRTLYGAVSRHELNPLLRLFDFPDPNITSEVRTETTVPLQQLFVLNSEFIANNAKALARRLTEGEGDDASRLERAFALLYARPPSGRERELGLAFLAGESQGALSRWEQYAQVLLAANEFMYVD